MTDLERIARVLAESWRKEAQQQAVEAGCDVLIAIDPFLERAIPVVRTVLTALREPNENTVAAGDLEMPVHLRFTKTDFHDSSWRITPIVRGDSDYVPPENVFRAMIDHILAGKS